MLLNQATSLCSPRVGSKGSNCNKVSVCRFLATGKGILSARRDESVEVVRHSLHALFSFSKISSVSNSIFFFFPVLDLMTALRGPKDMLAIFNIDSRLWKFFFEMSMLSLKLEAASALLLFFLCFFLSIFQYHLNIHTKSFDGGMGQVQGYRQKSTQESSLLVLCFEFQNFLPCGKCSLSS